jgi:hypothetical protein
MYDAHIQASSPVGLEQARQADLARLRQGDNRSTFKVATAGSERACLSDNAPELWDTQRPDLQAELQQKAEEGVEEEEEKEEPGPAGQHCHGQGAAPRIRPGVHHRKILSSCRL